MSTENDRSRRGAVRKGRVVSPEAASDHSRIQNVFDFLQDYVPQAVSGPKEDRKERVLWAHFETGDVNDLTMPQIRVESSDGGNEGGGLPLLLTLGLSNGYSIWLIMPGGDAREVYCNYREGEVARTVRLLKTPETPDAYADKRPIMAVVKKGRHSTSGSTVAYSTLHLVSLRASDEDGSNVVKKYVFKTRPIVDVQCNRRVVAVVFQKRIVLLDAGSLENRYVIKNNYPCSGFPCNPIGLGSRWLAYSEIKLSPKHQSIGGMSHTTTSSVATTMLKNVKKGISALTETISGLTAKAQSNSLEAADKSPQATGIASADIITVIDTTQSFPQDHELRLQDLGRESPVVAHFPAHAGPDIHVAGLAFNPSGNLLLSASTEGHTFHVFQLLPHPFLSSETAVHHLYTLYRGATSGVVQDMSFSSDSRWVSVSTLNGTTHVFPISPYGGEPTVRTHLSSRVVNKMSRFHTSAGIDSITTASQSHFHNSSSNATKNSSFSKQGQPHLLPGSQSPPQSSSRDFPSATLSFVNGYSGWSNPRSLPLPTPVSVNALQQIKQPYQSSSSTILGGVSTRGSGASSTSPSSSTSSSSSSSSSSFPRGEFSHGVMEPCVSLAGPDVVCVRALFGLLDNTGLNSPDDGVGYSLYVVGSNGVLVQHLLEPQKVSSAPEGEDAPIELSHYSNLCWKLLTENSASGCMALPLKEDNPLILANDMYRKFYQNCTASRNDEDTPSSDAATSSPASSAAGDNWLSQVEILTHAPPSRRLWMGPQFSFKTYQPPCSSSSGLSNSTSAADIIKTPSPPNTIIYSGSLNASVSSQILAGSSSRFHRNGESSGEQQTAVLLHSAENPSVDFFPESSGLVYKSLDTSPLSAKRSMELGQSSIDPGVVEVFGSWNQVAPHYEGAPFEGEVEKQLQDAIGEETDSITIISGDSISGDSSIKTGFSLPGP